MAKNKSFIGATEDQLNQIRRLEASLKDHKDLIVTFYSTLVSASISPFLLNFVFFDERSPFHVFFDAYFKANIAQTAKQILTAPSSIKELKALRSMGEKREKLKAIIETSMPFFTRRFKSDGDDIGSFLRHMQQESPEATLALKTRLHELFHEIAAYLKQKGGVGNISVNGDELDKTYKGVIELSERVQKRIINIIGRGTTEFAVKEVEFGYKNSLLFTQVALMLSLSKLAIPSLLSPALSYTCIIPRNLSNTGVNNFISQARAVELISALDTETNTFNAHVNRYKWISRILFPLATYLYFSYDKTAPPKYTMQVLSSLTESNFSDISVENLPTIAPETWFFFIVSMLSIALSGAVSELIEYKNHRDQNKLIKNSFETAREIFNAYTSEIKLSDTGKASSSEVELVLNNKHNLAPRRLAKVVAKVLTYHGVNDHLLYNKTIYLAVASICKMTTIESLHEDIAKSIKYENQYLQLIRQSRMLDSQMGCDAFVQVEESDGLSTKYNLSIFIQTENNLAIPASLRLFQHEYDAGNRTLCLSLITESALDRQLFNELFQLTLACKPKSDIHRIDQSKAKSSVKKRIKKSAVITLDDDQENKPTLQKQEMENDPKLGSRIRTSTQARLFARFECSESQFPSKHAFDHFRNLIASDPKIVSKAKMAGLKYSRATRSYKAKALGMWGDIRVMSEPERLDSGEMIYHFNRVICKSH